MLSSSSGALFLVQLFLCLSISRAHAADTSWKSVSYRNWDGCQVLQARGLRVVVAPAVGGRIVWFGTPEKNLLLEDANCDGKLLPEGSNWMPWDGCQTDLIDDTDQRQHGPVWLGGYDLVSAKGNVLILRSKVHPANGIQVTKRYELDPRLPGLHYSVTATNQGDKPAGWCVWERALFATPGTAYIPFRQDGPLKGLVQEGVPAGSVELSKGYAAIHPQGNGTPVITDSLAGWVAFNSGKYSTIVKVAVDPKGYYRKGETCTIYFADNRAELEPVGPRVELKKSESVTLTETWRLLTHKDPSRVRAADIVKAAQKTVVRQTR
jgi:hypothetical protein